MASINNANTTANAENNNFFKTGYEANPLQPDKAKIAELQQKSEIAKSIYLQSKNYVSSLKSRLNGLRANSIWNYNKGNSVDTTKISKLQDQINSAEGSCLSADFADNRARSTLRDLVT